MAQDVTDSTATEDQVKPDQVEDDAPEGEDDPDAAAEAMKEPDPAPDFDDDDLRNLSDEERAAFLGEDDTEDSPDQGEDDPDPAAQVPDTAAQAPVPDPAPVDMVEVQAKLAEATEKKRTEAFDQYEDGELTRDEYLARLREIDAETAQEAQFVQRQASFTAEAKRYFSEAPDLLNDAHLEAIDRHVRAITGDATFDKLTPRQILELAHSRYAADASVLGLVVPPVPGKKAKTPAPAPQAEAPAVQKRPEAPVTLAKVPAATITSAADGKYSQLQAAIDNADAETLERIMASLSEDEREAFASMDV